MRNLGKVVGKSAYEYAVEGGYEGTEEEFMQRMAEGGGVSDNIDILGTDLKLKDLSNIAVGFSQTVTIPWDGDITGKTVIDWGGDGTVLLYKVADPFPILVANNAPSCVDDGETVSLEIGDSAPGVQQLLGPTSFGGGFVALNVAEGTAPYESEYGLVIEEDGIYFLKDNNGFASELSIVQTFPISKAYLPQAIIELKISETWDPETGDPIYKANMTPSEILDAHIDGATIVYRDQYIGDDGIYTYIGGPADANFVKVVAGGGQVWVSSFYVDIYGYVHLNEGSSWGNYGVKLISESNIVQTIDPDDDPDENENAVSVAAVYNYFNDNPPIPAPTSDGVGLAGLDDEWVQQDGYPYKKVVEVSWDGTTSGKTRINESDYGKYFYLIDDSIKNLSNATVRINGAAAVNVGISKIHCSSYELTNSTNSEVIGIIISPEDTMWDVYYGTNYSSGLYLTQNTYELTGIMTNYIDSHYLPVSRPDTIKIINKIKNSGYQKTLADINEMAVGYHQYLDPITWNGDTTGLTPYTISGQQHINGTYYKISNNTTFIDGGKGEYREGGRENLLREILDRTPVDITNVQFLGISTGAIGAHAAALIIPASSVPFTIGDTTFTERGIYFTKSDYDGSYCANISGYTIEKIPSKYIDGALPGYSSHGDEGKILKIVDGVPTWVNP